MCVLCGEVCRRHDTYTCNCGTVMCSMCVEVCRVCPNESLCPQCTVVAKCGSTVCVNICMRCDDCGVMTCGDMDCCGNRIPHVWGNGAYYVCNDCTRLKS